MDSNKKSVKFIKTNEKIKQKYPDAKFDFFLTEASLNRIVSYNKYIIVGWIGDVCCGESSENHEEPKVYVVRSKSKEFITLDDVIRTLVENNFEVPCDFKCFEDIIPAINPLDNTRSIYFFSIEMSHIDP